MHVADVRTDALTLRVTQLERGQAALEDGQRQLLQAQRTTDGNVRELGAQMDSQFQEVLKQLAEMNSVKKARHSD
eukprot:1164946-Amphidinium_carterae.3